MLVVKVELWPFGDERAAKEIGYATISNDGTHESGGRWDSPFGNYDVALFKRGSRTHIWRTGRVENFARSTSVWTLLKRAIDACQ